MADNLNLCLVGLLIHLVTTKFCQAYEICVKKDLLKEQVFILGRMGNAKQALSVIINSLGDIEEVLEPNFMIFILFPNFGDETSPITKMQAIEFVSMQQDDELWEELIKQSFHKPEMVKFIPFFFSHYLCKAAY